MRAVPFALLATLTLAACGSPEPQQLAVGDCLTVSSVGSTVEQVPVVPCDGVHEAEVYAVYDVADADDYDEDAVIAQVEERCVGLFAAYVGEPYATSSLDIFYTWPLEDAWAEGGREAVCAAYVPDPDTGRPLEFEGTLAG